jgi:hypothetical protein
MKYREKIDWGSAVTAGMVLLLVVILAVFLGILLTVAVPSGGEAIDEAVPEESTWIHLGENIYWRLFRLQGMRCIEYRNVRYGTGGVDCDWHTWGENMDQLFPAG